MMKKTLDDAKEIVQRYISSTYPKATLVLLCGSWSRNAANEDSDIDVFILDPDTSTYVFTCLEFESWLLELCIVSPENFDNYIQHDTRRRDCTVSTMITQGVVIHGDDEIVQKVKSKAQKIVDNGPAPITDEEIMQHQKELTVLLKDLRNSSAVEIPALAALCHTALANAIIDNKGGWRGDQKTLRPALAKLDPDLATRLDEGLIHACQGNRTTLVELCQEVIENLGGEVRTYFVEYPAG
jgi:predicted nucleotidyltransferase